jgi:hypothetical protein
VEVGYDEGLPAALAILENDSKMTTCDRPTLRVLGSFFVALSLIGLFVLEPGPRAAVLEWDIYRDPGVHFPPDYYEIQRASLSTAPTAWITVATVGHVQACKYLAATSRISEHYLCKHEVSGSRGDWHRIRACDRRPAECSTWTVEEPPSQPNASADLLP